MDIATLFDLEDTLVQTPWSNHRHVLEFRRKTREKLIALGIPRSLLEGIERATIMRNKALDYVDKSFCKTKAERFRCEMDEFLSHYEIDSAKKSKLFPETISTLERLRESESKMGLITNTSIKAVNYVFELHGLKEYFDVVVTRENVKKLKPDPEGILLTVKKLRVTRFVMVGDLILDIVATKSAKGIAILVKRDLKQSNSQDTFKSLPAEVLREVKKTIDAKAYIRADYVVQSLAEVPNIVQSLEYQV
jgi:HAD superfamily hydrolase (TIGR01549 family)